jgi:putative NADH-flavin reductase
MRITVFGATGMVGKRIVQLALHKEIEVVAFGRNVETLIDADNRNELLTAQKGYIFDAKDVAKSVKGSQIIFSVLGGAFDGADKTRSLGIKNIIAQMEAASIKRIVALGGLGVLNATEDQLLIDTEGYPEEYKPVGIEHLQAFRLLESSQLDWSFFCPPNIINEDETGLYRTHVNFPPEPNTYKINAGDLAMAMLDAGLQGAFIKERVGICNK